MNAHRTEQLPCRYWLAVSVPATEVDDDLPDALASAADRAETVLQEEHGYKATVWRSAVPNRAEVLREAADVVDPNDDCECGGCDTCVPRKLADQLRRMADEATTEKATPTGEATPNFFQPGHTYRHGPWAFRCDAVTTHPETGERTALGWFRFRKSDWTAEHYGQDVWDEGTWAEGGDAR